jgi:hypothetical protein
MTNKTNGTIEDYTHRKWYKTWWVILILIILGFSTLSTLSGIYSDANKSNQANSTNSNSTAKIGEVANDGKFAFTVTSVKCNEPSVSDSTGYLTETAQGQYCLLNISVKNIGDEAQILDSSSQYLYNSSDQKYSSDSAATITVNPSNSTFLNSINPGNTVTGIVVFDMPKGVTPTYAIMHDSAFSNGVKVNLR